LKVRKTPSFSNSRKSRLFDGALCTTDEVASLVTYLASPLAAATNGAAVRVEGGLLRGTL
jgi:hypothetical protein